jgi:hypothetical protein
MRRDLKGLERTIGLVAVCLVSGTSVATIDVGVYKLSETREVIVSGPLGQQYSTLSHQVELRI